MKQTDWSQIGKVVLVAAAETVGLVAAICALTGMAIGREWVPMDAGVIITMFAETMVLFLMCYWAAQKAKQNRLPVCIAVATVFWVICLVGKALIFSEYALHPDWKMALPMAAAVVAGIASIRKKQRRK